MAAFFNYLSHIQERGDPPFCMELGVWNCLRIEPYFTTCRRMYVAFTRLRWSGRLAVLLPEPGTPGQLFFVLRYGGFIPRRPELVTLIVVPGELAEVDALKNVCFVMNRGVVIKNEIK